MTADQWTLILILLIIPVHELGHMAALWLFRMPFKLGIGKMGILIQHKKSDDEQELIIILTGILFGLIVLLFIPFPEIVVISILYVLGCRHDLRTARKVVRNLYGV